MAWLARALLVVLLLALVAPGPVAARALRTAVVRPWRLAAERFEPTARDRFLVVAVPAALLLLSRLALTRAAAPAHLLVTLGAWVLFALTARWLLRRVAGDADPFVFWAAIGGVAVLRTAVLLGALVARGPGGYWFGFWTDPAARTLYLTVAFAAFCWLFVVTATVLRGRYGLTRRHTAGTLLAATGVALGLPAGLVAVTGLERALTIWNDQMALLPWGLSRILGITVYLGIPPSLPAVAATAGSVLVLTGALLTLVRRPRAAG